MLGAFFSFIEKQSPAVIRRLLDIMGLKNTQAFKDILAKLLGEKERITREEFTQYAALAIQAKNIANCTVVPTEQDLFDMYVESFS